MLNNSHIESLEHQKRVFDNQKQRGLELENTYNFIVCGCGTSGAVVARRLAEQLDATVLVLEAGGTDDVSNVRNAGEWITNLGSERDWCFTAQPNPNLNDRTIPMNMGKVLGGGSSINAMYWSRGHRTDWDSLAADVEDPDWNYAAVAALYKKIENWKGFPDSQHRGESGLVHVTPTADLSSIPQACLSAYGDYGIPLFANQNGSMMESSEGASLSDVCIQDGQRKSIYRSYLYPLMDQPNVTVLTGALVHRVLFDGKRAVGVECTIDGRPHSFSASHEIVLSLGAVHTPKVLMQSGIGDADELRLFDIPVVEGLSGVGRNFQDHCMVAGCIWECPGSPDTLGIPHNAIPQANAFVRSSATLDSPDVQLIQAGFPLASSEIGQQYTFPDKSWTLLPVLVRPRSTGRLRLTGKRSTDPIAIEANMLSDPADLAALVSAIKMVNEISRSSHLKPFIKRQIAPGPLHGASLENFVRDAVVSTWHQTCTAKMGNDRESVVSSTLQVHGIQNLTVADGSVLRRVTTVNTMAPCVVIGERAALSVKRRHNI